jgi:hypothetical protein
VRGSRARGEEMIPFLLAGAFIAGIFVLFLGLLIIAEGFSVIVVTFQGLVNRIRGKGNPPGDSSAGSDQPAR